MPVKNRRNDGAKSTSGVGASQRTRIAKTKKSSRPVWIGFGVLVAAVIVAVMMMLSDSPSPTTNRSGPKPGLPAEPKKRKSVKKPTTLPPSAHPALREAHERRDNSVSKPYQPAISSFENLSSPRVGIVTTISDPHSESFETWMSYHLKIGFDHIYLFWDTPTKDLDFIQALVDRQELRKQITCIISDGRLHSRQRKTSKLYSQFGDTVLKKEQMARQMLNAETAIELAVEDGIDWILHIDSDELFYLDAESTNIKNHFGRLQKLGIKQAVYLNREAVYSDDSLEPMKNSGNLFKSSTVFKNNPNIFSKRMVKVMRKWRVNHLKYFMSYMNGKAAVRTDIGALPVDVTQFSLRHLNVSEDNAGHESYPDQAMFSLPAILHFTNAGLNKFQKKYERLFDAGSSMDSSPFMAHMLQLLSKKGERHAETEVKNLYEHVATVSKDEEKHYIANGLFSHISTVADFVSSGNKVLKSASTLSLTPTRDSTTVLAEHFDHHHTEVEHSSDETISLGFTQCTGAVRWVCFTPALDCCQVFQSSDGWIHVFTD